MKIAMWSGPRNLSTAMMYSFANRPDCAVVDEPFYSSYLRLTGLQHPMRAQILASQSQDPEVVATELSGSNPQGKPQFYQKHMTQHMVQGIRRDWMRNVTNVFLIRHPARVIASYAAKRENPTLDDIGFSKQLELLELVKGWGQSALVVDSHDIRDDPEGLLRGLCDALGLEFYCEMLQWPRGGHVNDGVWASHWYGKVWNSTSFASPEVSMPDVPEYLDNVLADAMPFYQELSRHKLQV
ncbi:HAD family hydrolase [Pseudopelagicola sp. nBUS_20]|uniref:sulfotransferase-like domain-containing protein n=1 Tax=Pseudopelagicola sp. nBUS_20 TaxID=3395317 RepID=UPI003EBB0FB1